MEEITKKQVSFECTATRSDTSWSCKTLVLALTSSRGC